MTVALIIGASRGIGREFVRQLLADGWQVFATARDDAAIDELKTAGAAALKVDVTSADSLAALGWQLDGVELDLAVYVAGVLGPQTGANEPPSAADFDALMHANVLGAMQAVPLIAPMVESAGGQFAFISSGMGSIADASSSHACLYRVSKAGLNMVAKCTALDYPKLTAIALSPGWVQTDMGGPNASLTPAQSVTSMRRAMQLLTSSDSGSFINHDGTPLAW